MSVDAEQTQLTQLKPLELASEKKAEETEAKTEAKTEAGESSEKSACKSPTRGGRIRLSEDEMSMMTVDDWANRWRQQDEFIDQLEQQLKRVNETRTTQREAEDKMKQQLLEATRRENVLVMRLTMKEQEMQDLMHQIQELKQTQIPTSGQLQNTHLDPAVNLMFDRMKKEVDSARAQVKDMQDELSAWKFTPDSNTGKRLMAKCKLLYQENEELGKMISSGRVAKLEADLALQKNFSEEMKKNQSEIDEFLLEIDEDVEGMQSTIYYLQQQLKDAKERINVLEKGETNKVQDNSHKQLKNQQEEPFEDLIIDDDQNDEDTQGKSEATEQIETMET